jgi:hypothetical protein
MIRVSSNPIIVVLLNLLRNVFSKNSAPFAFITDLLVMKAKTRGMTTNSTTDIMRVSHGMVIPLMPSKNVTIGINATRIIRSLMAT